MPMPRARSRSRSASVIPSDGLIGSVMIPAAQQRGVEAVRRVREVGLRRGGPEPGVDADEQQPEVRAEQVGHLGVAVGLELGAGEAGHGRSLPRAEPGPAGHRPIVMRQLLGTLALLLALAGCGDDDAPETAAVDHGRPIRSGRARPRDRRGGRVGRRRRPTLTSDAAAVAAYVDQFDDVAARRRCSEAGRRASTSAERPGAGRPGRGDRLRRTARRDRAGRTRSCRQKVAVADAGVLRAGDDRRRWRPCPA